MLNAQTRWVLERSGAPEPELLPHLMLRVRDVMRERFPLASHGEPVRQVGLIMARDEVDLVPVRRRRRELTGVMTERALRLQSRIRALRKQICRVVVRR